MLENMEQCKGCLTEKDEAERMTILLKMKLMIIIIEDYN